MSIGNLRNHLANIMRKNLEQLEAQLRADVLVLYSDLNIGLENIIKMLIEDLKSERNNDKIYIILTTSGGSLNPVERIVNIFRHFYQEVNFIIPDYAYSAGTILCMSGDNIYMNYHSVVGPIDPQVRNKDGKYIPALGYLDKIGELIQKSKEETLTDIEAGILLNFDLAELKTYEQEKELAINIVKDWLVKYKFKSWTAHSDGTSVTVQEKLARAEEIASLLSDNNIWKSHSRPINIDVLRNQLKLKIISYDEGDEILKKLIDDYYDNMKEFISMNGFNQFIQTRSFL